MGWFGWFVAILIFIPFELLVAILVGKLIKQGKKAQVWAKEDSHTTEK